MNTGEFFDRVESMYKDWQYDHPRMLYSLIKLLKPAVVVEVGTYIGYGACYMARALEENGSGHLFCIDNWQLPNPSWRPEPVKSTFINSLNALGLTGRVTLIEGESDKVTWPKPVDLVYIDGWHSYRAAKFDFEQAAGLGASCICFDDSISTVGPRMLARAVEMDDTWDVVTLNSAGGFTICTRRGKKLERHVTFSQELDGPGTELKGDAEVEEHLAAAHLKTGIHYKL